MADAPPAMALSLVDGRARMIVAARDLGLAVVERLEVEWPGVEQPPGPEAERLRNRRGRLLAAKLVVDRERLASHLADSEAARRHAGDLWVALEAGEILLSGRGAGPDARDATFAARLALGPGGGRKLRLAIRGGAGRNIQAREALAAVLGGPAAEGEAFEIDPLEAALDEIFVADGFRLPDTTGVRLGPVRISPSRVVLSWDSAGPEIAEAEPAEAKPPVDREGAGEPMDRAADPGSAPAAAHPAAPTASRREITELRRALSVAPEGPARAEVANLLAVAYERAGEEDEAVEALRVCIDNATSGPLIGAAWQRLVDLQIRGGHPQSAVRALIASADDPRVAASEAERAAALVAAARILHRRLNRVGDAGMVLERALELAPTSTEALEALGELTAPSKASTPRPGAPFPAAGASPPSDGPSPPAERAPPTDDGEPPVAERARPAADLALPPAANDPVPADDAASASSSEDAALEAGLAAPTAPAPSDAAGLPEESAPAPTYWRAVADEPLQRANHLIAGARALLAAGETARAVAEIEAARELLPAHAGAIALLADVCYRQRQWERARALYAELEATSDTGDVIARDVLVRRRAMLAARLGDPAEAESLYRELAILSPENAEARRALAELALARGDLATSARRLEEVLRLLPPGNLVELTNLRHRLGSLYVELAEWASARQYLELVLAQDPTRVAAVELILETYERLGLGDEAAEACDRLSRLYVEPSQRAAALYRQAELRRTRLGDEAGALDALLRSSDVDPTFVPARLRLIHHFWALGDLDVVADLASDLAAVSFSADDDELVARLAIATAGPRASTPPRFSLVVHPTLLPAAAQVLAEAGDQAAARGSSTLDSFVTRARFWLGPEGERDLTAALIKMVLADPGRAGPALALGTLAASTRRPSLARAAYSLPAFVDPDGLGAKLLEALPAAEPVRAEAVRVGGAVDHPDVAGPARRALARLAPALLGFATDQPAPKPVEGSGLPPARALELRRIADLLGAPPFVVAPDTDAPDKAPPSQSERRRLRLVPTQPAGLLIAASATRLGARAWSFVAGRAIEALRSGLVTAGLTSADEMGRLFEGARAALRGVPAERPLAQSAANWLARPESAVLLGGPEARAELLADVEAALADMPRWETFRRGTRYTCNRIGVLVSASPADALAVIADGEMGADGAAVQDRGAFLGGPAAAEILSFLFSPAYEAAAG